MCGNSVSEIAFGCPHVATSLRDVESESTAVESESETLNTSLRLLNPSLGETRLRGFC